MRTLLLASLFFLTSFNANAQLQKLNLENAKFSAHSSAYAYLIEEAKTDAAFTQKFPKAIPLKLLSTNIKIDNPKRDFFILQETGSYACGTRNCPIKVFDVTKADKPQAVLDIVAPPVVSELRCGNDYSLIFSGSGNTFAKWTFNGTEFEHVDTYTTEKEAARCKKSD